jgi:uncharacterized membrane protein YeaQ/YmgE (transglycosylase-associated protein family)
MSHRAPIDSTPNLILLGAHKRRDEAVCILDAAQEQYGPSVAFGVGMSIIAFIIVGILAGFIARAIMPGRQSMSFVATALLGMVGSFVGGLLGSLISREHAFDLHAAGLIGSVIGALLMLLMLSAVGRRRRLV